MRRLLPYERALIDALQISEEEYWQFYLARLNYRDNKEGTILDVRNGLEAGTVALILTIVGTLAQVGAALLAPKPETPSQKLGRQSRNLFFAPRYGFNSFQEVARYGDPINLVYTNIDENKLAGGLRVNTSLVWSAVHSFGSSQLMQMLAVVGAGPIQSFGYGRTAFGQTPLRDLPAQKYWLYANEASGNLVFANKQFPEEYSEDPLYTTGNDNVCTILESGRNRSAGYSQAFSPTTGSSLGLYDVVPIKVKVEDRDDEGRLKQDSLGINIISGRGSYWPDQWPAVGTRPQFPKGNNITIEFKEDEGKPTEDVERAAIDLRSAYITSFDSASLYKLGAAKFQLISDDINDSSDIEGRFTFKCVRSGVLCEEDYGTMRYQENEDELRAKKKNLEEVVIPALDSEKAIAFGEKYFSGFVPEIDVLTNQLGAKDEQIERATAILSGDLRGRDLYDYLLGSGDFPGLTRSIEEQEEQLKRRRDEIEQKRDEIDNINDQIDEILARRPFNNSDRDELRRVRGNKQERRDRIRTLQNTIRGIKSELKNLFARLSAKSVEQGLYDNNPRTNLREERRQLKLERRQIVRQIDALLETKRDFAAEQAAQQSWTARYNEAQRELRETTAELKNDDNWNDYFNTKCIAKINEISYEAISKCDVISFAFKSKVFQRVQGRMNKYAEEDQQGHNDSDNGVRNRTSLFWMWYKKPVDAEYSLVPYVFAMRGGREIDFYSAIKFVSTSKEKWQFKFEPIVDLPAELRTHNGGSNMEVIYLRTIGYGAGSQGRILGIGNGNSIVYRGRSPISTIRLRPRQNNTPKFIDEWGLFSLRSDTQISFSFESGPETALTAVTEQQRQSLSPEIYQDMSMLALNIYSGQGVQDLRSLSAWVTRGKKVRKLSDLGEYTEVLSASTSYAPEIFLDTVLDKTNGIGAYANINGINKERLGISQRFCRENGLFMDGIIAEQQSWREFWAQIAPYSLLEFARIGGKETLVPAVPYDALYKISRRVQISALFNQGNILEDSYKEEFLDYGDNTQDLIATVVYRDTENDNVFPSNKSINVKLKNAAEEASIRQTFDLSAFVTSKSQAAKYGMLLCQQRRYSRRAIEFKTFPTESPVEPGSYIYVQIDQNQWDDIKSGLVEAGGSLNLPLTEEPVNGSYTVLLYDGQSTPIKLSSVSFANGTSSSLSAYEGWLFVLGTELTTKRVFRTTEVTMEEEGEITIQAIEHPCDEIGGQTLSKIANFDEGLFDPFD